jgi:hypothetical protein
VREGLTVETRKPDWTPPGQGLSETARRILAGEQVPEETMGSRVRPKLNGSKRTRQESSTSEPQELEPSPSTL